MQPTEQDLAFTVLKASYEFERNDWQLRLAVLTAENERLKQQLEQTRERVAFLVQENDDLSTLLSNRRSHNQA